MRLDSGANVDAYETLHTFTFMLHSAHSKFHLAALEVGGFMAIFATALAFYIPLVVNAPVSVSMVLLVITQTWDHDGRAHDVHLLQHGEDLRYPREELRYPREEGRSRSERAKQEGEDARSEAVSKVESEAESEEGSE